MKRYELPSIGGNDHSRRCRSGGRREHTQLELAPVYTVCVLGELDMGNRRACSHKDDRGDTASLDLVPSASLIRISTLVVDPVSGREIHDPTGRLPHQGSDQHALTEHVLILYKPRGGIVRVLKEQRPDHRMTVFGTLVSLSIDVRHEPVFELHGPSEVIGELLIVLPGLLGRHAVASAMGSQHPKRHPSAVKVSRCPAGEAADVVAPE